jgi:hypothetical protein
VFKFRFVFTFRFRFRFGSVRRAFLRGSGFGPRGRDTGVAGWRGPNVNENPEHEPEHELRSEKSEA